MGADILSNYDFHFANGRLIGDDASPAVHSLCWVRYLIDVISYLIGLIPYKFMNQFHCGHCPANFDDFYTSESKAHVPNHRRPTTT